MTYDAILKYKEAQAQDSRRLTLEAVACLRRASATQVKKYLDKLVWQEAKLRARRRYEDGEITVKEISSEEKKYAKRNSRSLRTVQRWLKSLTKEGLLKRLGSSYIISDQMSEYVKFFLRGFGLAPLSVLCESLSFALAPGDYVREFKQAFGIYLLYIFSQILRINISTSLTERQKNEITYQHLRNGIPLTRMFRLFINHMLYSRSTSATTIENNDSSITKLVSANKVDEETIKQLFSILKKQDPRVLHVFDSYWKATFEGSL